MKKVFLVLVFTLGVFSVNAAEFEFGIGPSINLKDSVNSFMVMPSIGGKYLKFGLLYQVGSVAGITLQGLSPRLIVEYPFEFELSNNQSWSIGPIFDGGPGFAFGGGLTSISFFSLGFGASFKYFFNENMGVGFVPIHTSWNFASWTSDGIGIDTGLAIAYQLYFSFVYRW